MNTGLNGIILPPAAHMTSPFDKVNVSKYKGYRFFIGEMETPYAPSEFKITYGTKNQTVELIDGNELNILKNPKLTEISFDVELPRGRQYPFANKLVDPKEYIDYFNKLLLNKTPVKLLIIRNIPSLGSVKYQETEFPLVSLEGYEWSESADNAYDMKLSLTFKEYIEYGTVKEVVTNTSENAPASSNATVQTEKKPAEEKSKNYTVKPGDCLWNIAKAQYGDSTLWRKIYNANKTVIENTAKKYGKKSSQDGHWIYPGTNLVIPPVS